MKVLLKVRAGRNQKCRKIIFFFRLTINAPQRGSALLYRGYMYTHTVELYFISPSFFLVFFFFARTNSDEESASLVFRRFLGPLLNLNLFFFFCFFLSIFFQLFFFIQFQSRCPTLFISTPTSRLLVTPDNNTSYLVFLQPSLIYSPKGLRIDRRRAEAATTLET